MTSVYSALFLKIFEKVQASFLYWFVGSKLVHLGGKNLACFIWNLVQILLNLALISKSNKKWAKNC